MANKKAAGYANTRAAHTYSNNIFPIEFYTKKLPAYGKQFCKDFALRNGIHLWVGNYDALHLAGCRVRLGFLNCLALVNEAPSAINWSFAENCDVTVILVSEPVGYAPRDIMVELLRARAGHVVVIDHNGIVQDEQGRYLYANGRAA